MNARTRILHISDEQYRIIHIKRKGLFIEPEKSATEIWSVHRACLVASDWLGRCGVILSQIDEVAGRCGNVTGIWVIQSKIHSRILSLGNFKSKTIKYSYAFLENHR